MLIPKEKPHLRGLNSFYLHIEKLILHLQGELGCGVIFCSGVGQELQIFFDDSNVLKILYHLKGKPVLLLNEQQYPQAFKMLTGTNHRVLIHYLDQNSIYYWAQMPSYQRARTALLSTEIDLSELIERLCRKEFSGFIDVSVGERQEGGILFFHQGKRRGGSYSWGIGGLNTAKTDYERLLNLVYGSASQFSVAAFKHKAQQQDAAALAAFVARATAETGRFADSANLTDEHGSDHTGNSAEIDYDLLMQQFVALFCAVADKNGREEPSLLFKQKALELVDVNPFIDPFRSLYDINSKGLFRFSPSAPRQDVSRSVIDCAWRVIDDLGEADRFRQALNGWNYREALEKFEKDLLRAG